MLNRALLTVSLGIAPFVLSAAPVELRSADGFISVDGEIIEYDGNLITVETSVGVVKVPASEVECFGEGCLAGMNLGKTEQNLRVEVSSEAHGELFGILTNAFDEQDSSASMGKTEQGGVLLTSSDGTSTTTLDLEPGNDTDEGGFAIYSASLADGEGPANVGAADWATPEGSNTHLIALDALSVVVSDDVDVPALTLDQLAGIFSGKFKNWSELGGSDAHIFALQQQEGGVAIDDFNALVMAPNQADISSGVLAVKDDEAVLSSTRQFPGSIGIVSTTLASQARQLPIQNSCGFSVSAGPFSINAGDYPLVRPIVGSYKDTTVAQLATKLFDFASMRFVQEKLANANYVNQDIVQQSNDAKSDRLEQMLKFDLSGVEKEAGRKMIEVMFDANRLSLTLRDGPVTRAQGAWNRSNFVRLKEALAIGDLKDHEIIFVGFSDLEVNGTIALENSRAAATSLMQQFEQFASAELSATSTKISAHGFGGLAPRSCGALAETNRVEIWVRPIG